MKISALIAAGLLGLAATTPVAAGAAPVTATAAAGEPVRESVVVRERTTTTRYDDRAMRWGTRRVCRNEWRHHRKVRICRTARYRR